MSQSIDRASVASMKKAVVTYKRTNLNQAKMRKPQWPRSGRHAGASFPWVRIAKKPN